MLSVSFHILYNKHEIVHVHVHAIHVVVGRRRLFVWDFKRRSVPNYQNQSIDLRAHVGSESPTRAPAGAAVAFVFEVCGEPWWRAQQTRGGDGTCFRSLCVIHLSPSSLV